VYQDDSSDELSDVLDDLLLPSGSDNEELWNMDLDDEEEEEQDENEEDETDEDSEESNEDDGNEEEPLKIENGLEDEEMESD